VKRSLPVRRERECVAAAIFEELMALDQTCIGEAGE
jgi:hypothetical protein